MVRSRVNILGNNGKGESSFYEGECPQHVHHVGHATSAGAQTGYCCLMVVQVNNLVAENWGGGLKSLLWLANSPHIPGVQQITTVYT